MKLVLNKKQPAFSLLETIVVLFIVAVGLVSILSLTVDSLRAQNLNRSNLVAYNLAIEGIELVKNIRDTNFILNSSTTPVFWNKNIEGSVAGMRYKVDYANYTPVNVSNISECRLQLTTGADPNFYIHQAGLPDSAYSRMITVTSADSDPASSTVSSLVEWLDGGQTYQLELTTMLYDWE